MLYTHLPCLVEANCQLRIQLTDSQTRLERKTTKLEDARVEANLYSEQLLKSQDELRATKSDLRAIEDELKVAKEG